MKREELTALKIPEEAIDKIMAINGTDLEKAKTTATALKQDNDTLKAQLSERDRDIETLKSAEGDSGGVKKQLEQLKTKYAADTENYKKQLSDRDYSDAIRGTVASKAVKFSSKAAERAFVAELREAGLKLDGGVILGFDDFLTRQKASDPEAFSDGAPMPKFAAKTGSPIPPKDMSKMTYTEMAAYMRDNPDVKI